MINLTPEPATPDALGQHFRLHLFAVIERLLANLEQPGSGLGGEEYFSAFPFLNGYRDTLRRIQPAGLPPEDRLAWWQAQLAAFEAQQPGHLPLRALYSQRPLDLQRAQSRSTPAEPDLEVLALVAAGLVEEDIRFGALFAALQAPLLARRPCVGVLGWLLSQPGSPPLDSDERWSRACRRLIDLGLLLVENRADPRAEWTLRVPSAVWDVLRGQPLSEPAPGLSWQPAAGFPALAELILPEKIARQAANLPALLADQQAGALVVRGMAGSGRRTLLGAVARAMGRDLLIWKPGAPGDDTWRLLGGLAMIANVLPVLSLDLGPGEMLELPALPGYSGPLYPSGPVGIILGRSGGLRGPLVERAVSLVLPPPDADARRRFWQASGVSIAASNTGGGLEEVTARFLLTGGNIRRAAALSQAYAALEGRAEVTPADIQQAAQALNRQVLETLATCLEPAEGWNDLVVNLGAGSELRALADRCRERERLQAHAGPAFAHNLNRGVRALFSGPSGTGKTLAARALAAELQRDIYRVDLAAVVNKYIGETERNLNQVLSRAEELDVVLLLDEGDALMTRRTEVRNANDRYANLETNYLLQRLETFEGIAIITTNAIQRIDPAFLRRIDVVIDLTPPEATERWLIWHSHLKHPNQLSPALLEEVANRCTLTGGQIRNAALHAAMLALADNAPLGDAHLEAALQREYRKAGSAYPLRAQQPPAGQLDRLSQFLNEMY